MTVRRTLAVLAVGAALAAGAAALAPPAAAGGPTSALLVAPGTGRSAGLYHSDPRYTTLESLVVATDGTGTTVDAEQVAWSDVTVTWMIHDVTPWRVDRISVSSGEVLVTTLTDTTGTGDLWSGTAVVRPADRPGELVALLEDLGLLGAAPADAAGSPAGPEPLAAQDVAAPEATDGVAEVADGAASGSGVLRPAAAGAAGGLSLGAGGVLLVTAVRGRRARTAGGEGVTAGGPLDADLDDDLGADLDDDLGADLDDDLGTSRDDVVAGYPRRV